MRVSHVGAHGKVAFGAQRDRRCVAKIDARIRHRQRGQRHGEQDPERFHGFDTDF